MKKIILSGIFMLVVSILFGQMFPELEEWSNKTVHVRNIEEAREHFKNSPNSQPIRIHLNYKNLHSRQGANYVYEIEDNSSSALILTDREFRTNSQQMVMILQPNSDGVAEFKLIWHHYIQ